jgi:hypothetical protein
MKLSTRGRYATRMMVDLAEHSVHGPIPLKEIAERQDLAEYPFEGSRPHPEYTRETWWFRAGAET